MDNNNNGNLNNEKYPNGSFNNPNTTPRNDYNQQNYNYNQPNDYNQPNYDYNQQNYGFPNRPIDPGQNMAIASLVLGILSFLIPYINIILAVLSIIFSVVSANKSQEVGLRRNGMATAGLVCGIISCSISLIALLSCISFGGCALCYTSSRLSYPYY